MFLTNSLISLYTLCAAAAPVAAGPMRRFLNPTYQSHPERTAAVKAAFQLSWDGYYKHAFPHDSLQPISNTYSDDRYVVEAPTFGKSNYILT